MGLMDKVKQGAEQALTKAQHGVSQGKAKLDEAQAKRHWDDLLSELGAAVYAHRREGGGPEAVNAALAALDQHRAVHGAPAESHDGQDESVTQTGAPAVEGGCGTVVVPQENQEDAAL